MKKASMLLAALALLTISTGLTYKPVSATISLQSAARDARVSAERIATHVRHLASEKLQGRRTGAPGAEEAAAYIAEQFRSAGLKAPASGFFQPFTFVAGVKLGEKNSFQVKTAAGTRSLKAGEDYMPLAFSSSEAAAGPLVFAGYGISAPELQYDNYGGAGVAGKIVMILRGSPDGDNPHGRFAEYTAPGLEIQKKTLRAREKGAAGVIFVSGEQSLKEDRLSQLRHDLNFLDAGIPAVIVSRQTAESLLAGAGTTLSDAEKRSAVSAPPLAVESSSIEFRTDVVKINGKGVNVAGILEGSDPNLRSQYIIVGAHYDHLGLGGPESLAQRPEGAIHHGADDNASGTSALIELARVMAADRSKSRRSVIFLAFSGEELGLLGSAAYTKQPIAPLKSTVAMLNMDMVGRLRNGSLFVGGVGTSPAWKPLLEKLNAAGESPASSQGGGGASRFKLSLGQDGFGPSDHQSFYVKDIPVLFFFTGTHDDYHRPSDTAEKINAEGITQITQFVREVATNVANEDTAIAFNRVQTETRPVGRGFRVYLGTVPNYSDQNDGLKIDGVRPGSPAERAGLRAGDVVTKLAHIPIKNVYDYTYALGELRAGEEIEVVIRREGREMQLKLTPDKRQ
ncbi:MAG TPA: M28 family peptidase [Blastocatellia bacterium]|nr:M28 family peptidase [Blastocatellia bacterium]